MRGRTEDEKIKGEGTLVGTVVRDCGSREEFYWVPIRLGPFVVRRLGKGGELAPVTSCTVQLLAAQD